MGWRGKVTKPIKKKAEIELPCLGRLESIAFLNSLPSHPGQPSLELLFLWWVSSCNVGGALAKAAVPCWHSAALHTESWQQGSQPTSCFTHLPADASFWAFSPRIPCGGMTDVQKGGCFNKDLLYSTGNSAQCYVAVWMEGEFGGEWIHVCVWLNPFTIHMKP